MYLTHAERAQRRQWLYDWYAAEQKRSREIAAGEPLTVPYSTDGKIYQLPPEI